MRSLILPVCVSKYNIYINIADLSISNILLNSPKFRVNNLSFESQKDDIKIRISDSAKVDNMLEQSIKILYNT